MPVLGEDNNKSNGTPISELNADKSTSKLAEKIFSGSDGKNSSYLH